MSPTLGQMIMTLVDGLAKKDNFRGYTYLDEMKSDAILDIISALNRKSFKLENNSSSFSYMTTIATNSFIARINKEKKQAYVSCDYLENLEDGRQNEEDF